MCRCAVTPLEPHSNHSGFSRVRPAGRTPATPGPPAAARQAPVARSRARLSGCARRTASSLGHHQARAAAREAASALAATSGGSRSPLSLSPSLSLAPPSAPMARRLPARSLASPRLDSASATLGARRHVITMHSQKRVRLSPRRPAAPATGRPLLECCNDLCVPRALRGALGLVLLAILLDHLHHVRVVAVAVAAA